MSHLARMFRLSYLNLSCTRVGSLGMARLGVLTRLGTLVLVDTEVDDDAVESLIRAVPGLVVRR